MIAERGASSSIAQGCSNTSPEQVAICRNPDGEQERCSGGTMVLQHAAATIPIDKHS
jgi:hypothetical protein